MAKPFDTAVLLFTRSAEAEAAVKTFSHKAGGKGNADIARCLIRHSQRVAKGTGLPLFTSFGPQQKGHSFGERLGQAMEVVFEQGFQKVIVIGNDCPALTTKTLTEVHRRLETEKLVLGPATDGGVYLIGMDQVAFKREAFTNLPWEKSHLQDAFVDYADGITWLESLADIDQAQDLRSILNRLHGHSRLVKALEAITSWDQPCILPFRQNNAPLLLYRPILSLRAPPL